MAGALGLAGAAALAAVDAVAPLPGQTVLISGATGDVGAFAVQLAAASGAFVISTARPGEDDDAFLRDLGAHATVTDTCDVTAAVTALRRILQRLADDVVHGQLTVPVQRTYPLADVPRALADFTAGTRGKLAISVA